ncbi:MAG: hypothetical protein IJ685_14155 [Selenomonadaceae bacterium]|nr:hypothetical protein [Selenomonadaceae bacterium]
MKKFLSVMILAAAIIFVGQNNHAAAAEVYVGTYSDGDAVYLLTETIYHPLRRSYKCTVRAGRSYIDYRFLCNDDHTVWSYTNSEGYRGSVYDGSSPVASNILNYMRNNR